MDLDWSNGDLGEGLAHYNAGRFFAAHESWERVWLTCPEPEKTFLQAVIQVAAAFHHLQRGNVLGAESLLSRALRRMQRYPKRFAGIEAEGLREDIRRGLEALSAGNEVSAMGAPRIGLSGDGDSEDRCR
jgi:uncharacterized protein